MERADSGGVDVAPGIPAGGPIPHASASSRLSVAILGIGDAAAALTRTLASLDSVDVAAVWAPRLDCPAGQAAEEVGALVLADLTAAARDPQVDVVIDASGDDRMHAAIAALLPRDVELVSGSAVRLLGRALATGGGEHRRLAAELQAALERVRGQERRLLASRETLVRVNESLELELSEMFFMHEFVKALTAYTDPIDVCSLVVDGANGMFGATVSAIYLVERSDWTLRLCFSQGMPAQHFRATVPVSETILGEAFAGEAVQYVGSACSTRAASWIEGVTVDSHAAVPLHAGDDVIAVLAMGFHDERVLDPSEVERFVTMADQTSLALQNALLHRELERLSVTDRLTGLYNHGHFEQRLESEISRAERFGHPLSLIMLDIDDFKSFNDSYGHPAGDDVLRRVSAVISGNLRDMDIAARYGGEEFVVVVPETGLAGALRVGERIRSEIEELSFDVSGTTDSRSVSVGIAQYPADAACASELVDAADRAMYEAKRTGKNRVITTRTSTEEA